MTDPTLFILLALALPSPGLSADDAHPTPIGPDDAQRPAEDSEETTAAATKTLPSDPRLPWAEVLAVEPDAEVVTDAEARARMEATGWPWKVRHRDSGIELLLVPPGEFLRGSLEDNPEYMPDEYPPQHMLVEDPYYFGRTEVTRAQWLAVMGSDPTEWESDDLETPVTHVSFNDVQGFLAKTGLELPRSSEWEYACRAGTTGQRYGPIEEIAWYSDNSTHPMPVGRLKPNPWGFHDTIGNVWELTTTFSTALGPRWTEEPQLVTDEDEISSYKRVIRGAGGGLPPIDMRAPYRLSQAVDHARKSVGFRVAFHLDDEDAQDAGTSREESVVVDD